MSDRPCNRCDFERRKRDAKKQHKKLRATSDRGWMKVQIAEVGTDDWKDIGVSYYELPQECAC